MVYSTNYDSDEYKNDKYTKSRTNKYDDDDEDDYGRGRTSERLSSKPPIAKSLSGRSKLNSDRDEQPSYMPSKLRQPDKNNFDDESDDSIGNSYKKFVKKQTNKLEDSGQLRNLFKASRFFQFFNVFFC
jgi:hypothetical protein